MTLYLKYRPQKVAELDLVSAREMLTNILSGGKDKLPHAWLFSGPRGIGKTSAARILAKVVNCPHFAEASRGKEKNEPCNECEMCQAITGGSAVDVAEIDAASNRGIDEIRELRERIRLAPMKADYKVYIIDEVHMLTTEAANALLKTLEEPPEKTLFVLCTTEPEKLPETIVSRCTRVQFKRPSISEIVSKLERVIAGEKIKGDRAALAEVARASRGSFRDAIKILEQVWLAGEEVTVQSVNKTLGVLEAASPEKFLQLVRDKDLRGGLDFVNSLAEQGVNLRQFVERCVEHLREQLLAKVAVSESAVRDSFELEMIGKLEKVYEQLKMTAVPQLPLEVLVMENSGEAGDTPNSSAERNQDLPNKPEAGEKFARREAENNPKPVKRRATAGKYSLADVEAKWVDIMKSVKPKNHSVEALLRSTRPRDFDGEKLELEVFYKFHLDKLGSEKCRTIVEAAVGEVLGIGPVRLYLQLGQKRPAAREELTADEVGEDIVKAAAEIFKAEVM
ncbi:DNA polymerase III, subunit gamma and tau [Candidatus Amesbacteria bacterium RIFCSPLOWO2_02_FULL_48_11]|nr:MAG: DNA polymerase III, subunit gamma and tau [Candidatus Amesbacteria bacterium RBG_19FT_COMBO_48_16]OGC97550.1 MAG: DNA polymerase III, subunit gamma and tau [Candidatus Amesbacteria bacterium RBG_16_48_31]OGD08267.1 MAG: DNA polymerase III, subunit gamma and tau [Candidatus Amesbacteria bacterium RIFCSPLOWO2_02_FULL_48_11]